MNLLARRKFLWALPGIATAAVLIPDAEAQLSKHPPGSPERELEREKLERQKLRELERKQDAIDARRRGERIDRNQIQKDKTERKRSAEQLKRDAEDERLKQREIRRRQRRLTD